MQEVFLGGAYIPPEGSTSYLNDRYGKDLFHELRNLKILHAYLTNHLLCQYVVILTAGQEI